MSSCFGFQILYTSEVIAESDLVQLYIVEFYFMSCMRIVSQLIEFVYNLYD